MTFMFCPLCRDKVLGGDLEGLSQSLQEHLRIGHGMTELASPDRGKVLRPAYDAHDKDAVGTRWETPGARGGTVPTGQEVTDFVVRCPFCAETVTGASENDLTEQVKEHWSNDHDLRASIRSSLSSIRGGKRTL